MVSFFATGDEKSPRPSSACCTSLRGATRRAVVTANRPGSAVIEFPNDLDVVITREFDAPIRLVFDITTKPEHVRKTFAPFGEEVTVCSIDLRVGGDYHF